MSSVSYANVAAGVAPTATSMNGSSNSSSENVPQDLKVDASSTTTNEVDDSSATTEEDVKEQEASDENSASATSNKAAATNLKSSKKEKPKAKLAPAPVPKVSPWVKKSSTSPKSSNVNDKHWPTPEVSVLEEQNTHNKSKNVVPTIRSTGKEKWVPFQASVVMSGPKGTKGNNQNNPGNQKRLSKGKKGPKQDLQPKQGGARRNQKQTTPKSLEKNSEEENAVQSSNVTTAATSTTSATSPTSTIITTSPTSTTSGSSTKHETAENSKQSTQTTHTSQQSNGDVAASETAPEHETGKHEPKGDAHDFKPHSHQNHNRQYSNGNNVRRYNNRPQHGYLPFNRNLNFIPTTYLPSGQVFQPRGYNPGFIPPHPQQDGFRRFNNGYPPHLPPNNFNNHYPNVVPILPINPAVQQINQINAQDPVTSLAFQVDYYFSVQNLVKDIFLRKQMDSEGYIPLKVIANFYRVQHLSGGDLKLVVDSLDSCNNLEYVGNKETFDIKLRAKENPLNWVLSEDQRE